jgi:hypothetical protein
VPYCALERSSQSVSQSVSDLLEVDGQLLLGFRAVSAIARTNGHRVTFLTKPLVFVTRLFNTKKSEKRRLTLG